MFSFYLFIAFLTSKFRIIFLKTQIKSQLTEEYYRETQSYNKLVIVSLCYKRLGTKIMFIEWFTFLYP